MDRTIASAPTAATTRPATMTSTYRITAPAAARTAQVKAGQPLNQLTAAITIMPITEMLAANNRNSFSSPPGRTGGGRYVTAAGAIITPSAAREIVSIDVTFVPTAISSYASTGNSGICRASVLAK